MYFVFHMTHKFGISIQIWKRKTIQQSFTEAFEVIGTRKITSTLSTAQFTMRPYEVHGTLCPTSVTYGPISILRPWKEWILGKEQKYMAQVKV